MKALLSRMKNYWFSRLLWKYFWAIVGLIAIPVTILNVLWTGWSGEAMEKEMFGINEQMLLRSAGMMDSTLQSIKDLTYCLATSHDVIYMAFESKEDISRGDQLGSVGGMLHTLRLTYEYIEGIYVYYSRADAVLYSGFQGGLQSAAGYRDADWMQLYLGEYRQQICHADAA